MDLHMLERVKLGDQGAILTASAQLKSLSDIIQVSPCVRKAYHKDTTDAWSGSHHPYTCPAAIAAFLTSALQILLAHTNTKLSEYISAHSALFDLIGDVLLQPDYIQTAPPNLWTGLYDLLARSISVSSEATVCDTALRSLYILPDTDTAFARHMQPVIPGILELMTNDFPHSDVGRSCIQALSSSYRPDLVDSDTLCRALAVIYERLETERSGNDAEEQDAELVAEELIPQMSNYLGTHEAMCESGVFAAFWRRCNQLGMLEQLGAAVQCIMLKHGAGSPLFREALEAQSSQGFAEWIAHQLDRLAGDEKGIVEMLEAADRMVEMGGEEAKKNAAEAGIVQAVEHAICYLALDRYLDNSLRALAKTLLKKLNNK